MTATEAFLTARDCLLAHREEYTTAYQVCRDDTVCTANRVAYAHPGRLAGVSRSSARID
jgi:hypothetical protein